MKTFKESLGRKIREYRKLRSLTQEKLAELIGVNIRQITRIESGVNYPSAESLERICNALEVSPDKLYEFEWQIKEGLIKTGTDGAPALKLIQKDKTVTVKSDSAEIKEKFKTKRSFPADQTERSMLETARNMNQPIRVEYFDGRERANIKIFYPDGTIETLLSQEQIETHKLLEKLNEKIKTFGQDKNKLDFLLTAAEALNDKTAIQELKYLIKGIELTLK